MLVLLPKDAAEGDVALAELITEHGDRPRMSERLGHEGLPRPFDRDPPVDELKAEGDLKAQSPASHDGVVGAARMRAPILAAAGCEVRGAERAGSGRTADRDQWTATSLPGADRLIALSISSNAPRTVKPPFVCLGVDLGHCRYLIWAAQACSRKTQVTCVVGVDGTTLAGLVQLSTRSAERRCGESPVASSAEQRL